MPGSVLVRALRDLRRGLLWWTVGLVGFVALIVAVWPSVRDNPALIRLHDTYPRALKAFVGFGGEVDFGTPTGYLAAELFSLVVPLLLLVAAIAGGARGLAGEEERGTLDLLLAQPVTRTRVALEKLAALAVELLALAGVLWLALWIGTRAASMELAGTHLLAAVASAFLLALAFGAVAMLVGAATGRRAYAIATAGVLAVAAYLLNALSPLVHPLHTVRWLSPWYHYAAGDPLRGDLAGWSVLVLAAIAVAAAALTPVVLERRDLRSP